MKQVLAILAITSLFLAGCTSPDESIEEVEVETVEFDDDPCTWFKGRSADLNGSSHSHSMAMNNSSMGMSHAPIEVGHNQSMPCVKITLYPDTLSGYNIHIETTNFTFAPTHVSTEHIMGEGHAHVYVNGTKVARAYTNWLHLPMVGNGSMVMVELNANSHAPYSHHGIQIMDEIMVGHDAMHMNNSGNHSMNHSGHMNNTSSHGDVNASTTSPPSVSIESVTVDPKTANSSSQTHIIEISVENFTFSPMMAGMDHVDGQGHAHYYLNGEKIGRLYGNAFDVSGLTEGNHTLMISLNSNHHGKYVLNGEPVMVEITLTVPATE
jgi:hypothetical protein